MKKDLSNHIIVKFMDDDSENIKDSIKETLLLKKLHSKKKMKHSKIELIELHEDDDIELAIKELHNHPRVHYAQLNHKLYPYLPEDNLFDKQWGLCNQGEKDQFGNVGVVGIDINIKPAWEITRGNENVVVAVIDTGTDINHLDLKNNIFDLSKTSENLDLSEWDFADGDLEGFSSPVQALHGTMTSGIIAGEGISGIVGVAPSIKILPLKFMSEEHGYTADAIEAIEYSEKNGVKIVNCSWGSSKENAALEYHIENSSMLFVCASGNEGSNITDKPNYPASFDLPNVISVAAINNQGELWSLSNYGDKVHVAAPGTLILSTVPSADENSYSTNSGTSFAAPYVTGIAALLLSVNPSLSAEQIKSTIIESVKPIPELVGKVISGGLVDAHKALTLVIGECQ